MFVAFVELGSLAHQHDQREGEEPPTRESIAPEQVYADVESNARGEKVGERERSAVERVAPEDGWVCPADGDRRVRALGSPNAPRKRASPTRPLTVHRVGVGGKLTR
jgi:hypothetical protein